MMTKKKSDSKKNLDETKHSTVFQLSNPTQSETLRTVIISGFGIIVIALFLFVTLITKNKDQWGLADVPVSESNVVSSNENQGELPQFFPSDFPVYTGALLKNNWTTQSTNVTGVSVAWETKDSPVKVYNYYFTELNSLLYKVEVLSQTEATYTLSFSKNNTSGFIGITKVEDSTLISVTIGIKNEQ